MKLAPGFPSLADEIAEPRPDMKIKVAAFTVSEKSINIWEKMNCKQQKKLNYASVMVIRFGHLIYVIRIYMTEQEISLKKSYTTNKKYL